MSNTGNEGVAQLLKAVARDIDDGRDVKNFNYVNDRDGLDIELSLEQTFEDTDD